MSNNKVNNLIKSLNSLNGAPNQKGTTDQNILKEIIELKQNQIELQENARIANKKIENSIKKIEDNETKLEENCNQTNKHSGQIDDLDKKFKQMVNNLTEKASQDYANNLDKKINEINLSLEKILRLQNSVGKLQEIEGDVGMKKEIEILKEKQKAFDDSLASIVK